MSIFDIVLSGAALSMDAAAVGMANGMAEPRMSRRKTFLIALFFGVFQGGMPLLGYFGSSVFSSLVGRIAPYLSFMLLLFLGGKMLLDAASEEEERFLVRREGLRLPALTAQAVATSVDALAVGVSFMAQEAAGSLPLGVPLCALIIAATTRARRKNWAGSCSFSSASNCCLKHFEGVLSACLDKMPSLCYTGNGNISRTRE